MAAGTAHTCRAWWGKELRFPEAGRLGGWEVGRLGGLEAGRVTLTEESELPKDTLPEPGDPNTERCWGKPETGWLESKAGGWGGYPALPLFLS